MSITDQLSGLKVNILNLLKRTAKFVVGNFIVKNSESYVHLILLKNSGTLKIISTKRILVNSHRLAEGNFKYLMCQSCGNQATKVSLKPLDLVTILH